MRKRVLILDDDESNAEALALIMQEEGYEALSIISATDLLQTITDFNPHILLLDIQLGTYDGRILCRNLKQQAATKHLPIILISAMLSSQLTETNANEDGMINKPFEIDELISMVERLLKLP